MFDLTLRDARNIERLNHEGFPIPSFANKLYFSRKGIVLDGELAAAGFLKLTSEAILMIDLSLPRITRARLIAQLLQGMMEELEKWGLEDCHVFLGEKEGEKMSSLIQKFAFIPAKGRAFYLPPKGV